MLDRLRYVWSNVVHGPRSLMELQPLMLELLIGHRKIIGWEKGLPVRSLCIPPENSPAFVRSGAVLFNGARYGFSYPNVATLDISGDCDCRCSHCIGTFRRGLNLPKETWIRVIRECQDLGVFLFMLEGGEPLLNRDLPEIISSIDRDRSNTVLFTNATRLEEQVGQLKAAGLTRVYVSFDYPDARHDGNRQFPGLFDRALRGLQRARRSGMFVGISTFVTPERFYDGTLAALFTFAKVQKAHEVFVLDAIPAGCLKDREDLKSPAESYRADLRTFMGERFREPGAPGVWWYDQVRSVTSAGCTAGVTQLHVCNDGGVSPCQAIPTCAGSVLEEPIATLWFRLREECCAKRERNAGRCLLLSG